MTTPDPVPDTLEQLFGPAPAVAPVTPTPATDSPPPPVGGAPGPAAQV